MQLAARWSTSMRVLSNLRRWRCQSGNPPNSLCVRWTRTPLKLGPRLAYIAPARSYMRFSDTKEAYGIAITSPREGNHVGIVDVEGTIKRKLPVGYTLELLGRRAS